MSIFAITSKSLFLLQLQTNLLIFFVYCEDLVPQDMSVNRSHCPFEVFMLTLQILGVPLCQIWHLSPCVDGLICFGP
jgi:hypothetical protein